MRAMGFTLIETLIATVVLVSGMVAVAGMFAYSAQTALNNQRRTSAAALLYEKMEQFRSTPSSDSMWSPGGSLNPTFPAAGYFDDVILDATGSLNSSTTDPSAPFIRVWQVLPTVPRSVTIAVYALKPGSTRRALELVRATTVAGSRF